jgi:hypothetical protein
MHVHIQLQGPVQIYTIKWDQLLSTDQLLMKTMVVINIAENIPRENLIQTILIPSATDVEEDRLVGGGRRAAAIAIWWSLTFDEPLEGPSVDSILTMHLPVP